MFEWAGVSSVQGDSQYYDSREQAFVNEFTGTPYNGLGGSTPFFHSAPDIEAAWNDLFNATLTRLVLQSPMGTTLLPEFEYDSQNDLVMPVNDILQSLQGIYQRLGNPTQSNSGEWDLALRAADAYQLQTGMSEDTYELLVASVTSDEIGSLANAIASNLAVSFNSAGIVETGTPLNDTFYAGAGISDLVGGGGGETYDDPSSQHDTFVYNVGDGSVEIDELDALAWTTTNTLQLGPGITSADVSVAIENGDVILTLTSGATIKLDEMAVKASDGVQYIEFADGTTWSRSEALALASAAAGASYLVGTSGADRLDGGDGNVYAIGAGGNDTFVFNQGYGRLEINEQDSSRSPQNVVQFGAGIVAGDISVTADEAGDALFTIGANGDQIVIDGMFSQPGGGVQLLQFADGSAWNISNVITAELNSATPGSDTLYGSGAAEYFDGKGGSDLEIGGGGGDTFEYNAGYGALEINEIEQGSGTNTLLLGNGINESALRVGFDSLGDVVISDGVSGDSIQLDGMFSSNKSGVQKIEFADGTVLTRAQLLALETTGTVGADTLYGTSAADLFDGRGGGDIELGGGGNDTFVYNVGYGHLEVSESDANTEDVNVLRLGAGITASSLIGSANGNNLVLTDGATGDQITVDSMLGSSAQYDGVQAVTFADGTMLSRAQLVNLETTGTSGADALVGSSGVSSVFDGRGGNDKETGYGGNDTFVYNTGYGHLEINESDTNKLDVNVLQLGAGITTSSLTASSSNGFNLLLSDGVTGDQIQLDGVLGASANVSRGVQEVELANGTTLSLAQLITLGTTGTSGADTLVGSAVSAAVFDGRGGNDKSMGYGQNDTFVYNSGYGHLEISETYGTGYAKASVLELGAGITEAAVGASFDSSGDVILTDGVTGDRIQIDYMESNTNDGVQSVQFADGTVWTAQQVLALGRTILGTTGADTLTGSTGADVFDGKGGNDDEIGNGGNDTYVMKQGYGALTILNGVSSSNVAAGDLSLQGVNPNDIWLQRVGNNLQVDIMGSKTEATIQNWFTNTYSQLGELTVSGGSSGNLTLDKQISQLIQAMTTFSSSNPGFDPTSTANPTIADPTVLAAVNSAWHQ